MRILFISDNKINGFGGGCLENRKHYFAIRHFCDKNQDELKVISLDDNIKEKLNILVKKTTLIDILSRILHHSSYLYVVLLFHKKEIIKYHPDLIYLGRSRLGFFARFAKRYLKDCKVITNVDNVEVDYVDACFANSDNLIARLRNKFEKSCVKNDEIDAIRYSDELIFLTKRNYERYEAIYHYSAPFINIVPICINKPNPLYMINSFKTVVFVGSLDYISNYYAAVKLLSLWKLNFTDISELRLIIAGRNPGEKLVQLVKECKNVVLISNYTNIEDIVPRFSLMLAPIEKGAGMKVKVAESLGLGLLVGGSDEALVGYEESLKDNMVKSYIFKCNCDDDYIECINSYLNMSYEELLNVENNNKQLFDKYYSFPRADISINSVLEEMKRI